MFTKKEMEFLEQNFKAAIINANSVGAHDNASMWANVLLKLQTLPTEDSVKNIHDPNYRFNTFSDKVIVKKLREIMVNEIDLSQHNLAVKVGKINYTETKADVVVEVYTNTTGKSVDKTALLKLQYMADLPKFAHLGFTEKHFLKEFVSNGRTFEFTGFITTGKKYIYRGRLKGTDEPYKFTESIRAQVL